MQVELQATCASIGYLEGDNYVKEPDCLETVKDLIRFLKREDETCDIRRYLGEAQVLQKDLVNLLKFYSNEAVLFETVVRLLVNLTQPAKLCFQNQVPEDKTTRNYFIMVESYLQSYKEAFADVTLFTVLTKKLGELLQLDWEHQQEEDRLLTERLLILIRNILHVPPDLQREKRTEDDASVHDLVLWAMHSSGMEDLLLFVSSSDEHRQYAFHVLEIISLIFKEQTPEQLACAGGPRSLTERQRDERELAAVREQEQLARKLECLKKSGRHSRFGGTYCVNSIKSISDRPLIYHNSLAKLATLDFDRTKRGFKRPKNRKPLTDQEFTRRSTLSIRLFLKEFCLGFLDNSYNTLMAAVKDTLERSRAQENDETYYLWALKFFMEFNRLHSTASVFRVDLVSETLSIPSFHYIQTNIIRYHEMRIMNKKQGILWSKRMHLAIKAYGELLSSLMAMDESNDEQVKESAKVIKGNIFYMMEYRDVFPMLLRRFDETQQSRAFLRDLIETTHVFLKMLEKFCKQNKHMVVQRKKKRMVGRRRRRRNDNHSNTPSGPSRQELEELWDSVSSDLSAVLQGRLSLPTEGIAPFDAAADVDIEQQRATAMLRIQTALRQSRAAEAVALLQAAREVWPEREEFGTANMAEEDEFMAMREIFLTTLPGSENVPVSGQEQDEEVDAEDGDIDADGEEEIADEEEAVMYETGETEFNFKEYVLKFAHPLITKAYMILLGDFANLTPYTIHTAVKMLHRIGFDCHLIGLLFQMRLFRVLHRVLTEVKWRAKQYENILTFAKQVMRKFFEVAQRNPKVFMELFFWKSCKEASEIVNCSYGSHDSFKNVKQLWTEEQDDEIRRLFEEFQNNPEGENDAADYIVSHLIDSSKTRRQVVRQMCFLGLIAKAKDLKKSGGAKRSHWLEEEEFELRELVDRYRESDDPVQFIMDKMKNPRSRNAVIKKIMDMGLVADKRELRKKRTKGVKGSSKKSSSNNDDFIVDKSDESDDGNDGHQEHEVNRSTDEHHSNSSDDDDGDGNRNIYKSASDDEDDQPLVDRNKKSSEAANTSIIEADQANKRSQTEGKTPELSRKQQLNAQRRVSLMALVEQAEKRRLEREEAKKGRFTDKPNSSQITGNIESSTVAEEENKENHENINKRVKRYRKMSSSSEDESGPSKFQATSPRDNEISPSHRRPISPLVVKEYESGKMSKILSKILSDSDSDGDHLIIAEDVVTDRERHLQATPNKNELLSKSDQFPATMLTQTVESDSDIDDHIPLTRAIRRPARMIDSDDEI